MFMVVPKFKIKKRDRWFRIRERVGDIVPIIGKDLVGQMEKVYNNNLNKQV